MFSLRKLFGFGSEAKKPGLSAGENRQIAATLAKFFGTYRTGPPSESSAQPTGRWTLQIMKDVPGREVDLLRAIANQAISEDRWPEEQTSGTKAFEQVAKGIGDVCGHLGTHGLPVSRAS